MMKAMGRYSYFSAWAKRLGRSQFDIIMSAFLPPDVRTGKSVASSAVSYCLISGTFLIMNLTESPFSFCHQNSACLSDLSASLPSGAPGPNDVFCWSTGVRAPFWNNLCLMTFLFPSSLFFHSLPRSTPFLLSYHLPLVITLMFSGHQFRLLFKEGAF